MLRARSSARNSRRCSSTNPLIILHAKIRIKHTPCNKAVRIYVFFTLLLIFHVSFSILLICEAKRERRNSRLGAGVKTFPRRRMRAHNQSINPTSACMKLCSAEEILEFYLTRICVSQADQERFSIWAIILSLKYISKM